MVPTARRTGCQLEEHRCIRYLLGGKTFMGYGSQARIDAGIGCDWNLLPAHLSSLKGVEANATELRFRRVGNSQRGIAHFQQLRRL